MVHKVGWLDTKANTSVKNTDANDATSAPLIPRAVVRAQAKNIDLLTGVICGSNASLFLQHDDEEKESADLKFGPLAAGMLHATCVWPLQTPVYAALSLGLEERCPENDRGFFNRIMEYSVLRFARDIDDLLLLRDDTQPQSFDQPLTIIRCRLLLRWYCQLAKIGAVAANATDEGSICGLLETIVQAIVACNNSTSSVILASLVLSVLPYVTFVSADWIQSHILDPLESVMTTYLSDYAPGIGKKAILLQGEQLEDIDVDQEEEDDEEDDEEAAGQQVCDTLQDLWRTCKQMIRERDEQKDYRFALFTDAPWELLTVNNNQEQDIDGEQPAVIWKYKGEPHQLGITAACASLSFLVGGQTDHPKLSKNNDLVGVLFGRLPIFGAPPDLQQEDDDGDEEGMDEEGEAQPSNDRIEAYQKNFGLTDRFFLGEAIRDLLLCHESSVSMTGVERGSIKNAAEQVWSITQMVKPFSNVNGDERSSSKGIEYLVLETILSLIAQCSGTSVFDHMYLSRVILELTRMEPTIMSPAIAVAVSNLFQDYVPALTPAARYNLSRWLAFHLINTDYQWPASFWKHWEPFVLHGWSNSRGAFVKHVLEIMVENLSNPELLVSLCLPKESILIDYLLAERPEMRNSEPFESLQADITKRMKIQEDPSTLLSYLVGDELSESMISMIGDTEISEDKIWWRTGAVLRAILSCAPEEYERYKNDIQNARVVNDSTDMNENNVGHKEDTLSSILTLLDQYKTTIIGVKEKDAEGIVDGVDLSSGDVFILEQLNLMAFYSRTIMAACVQAFLQHRLVNIEGLLKWLLGDFGVGESNPEVILRWWEISSYAIQQEMTRVVSLISSTDTTKDGQGSGRTKAVLEFLDPLLSYIVGRVGSILSTNFRAKKGNRLTPLHVDLVEGFKYIVVDAQGRYFSLLQDYSIAQIHDAWAESAVAGSKLASLLDIGGNPATDLLRRSLEHL
jgi:hypothetical protein